MQLKTVQRAMGQQMKLITLRTVTNWVILVYKII